MVQGPSCQCRREVQHPSLRAVLQPVREGQGSDMGRHKAATEEESLIGINEFFKWVEANRYKIQYKYLLNRFSGRTVCHECKGSRLRKDALYVKVGGKNIYELLCMNAAELLDFLKNIKLTAYEKSVAGKAIDEIKSRLQYIADVGLGYLTLNRACNTLSGGESQRINLVTALGSSLVGSMYILDEPSIGLHPRDTEKLIGVLKRLRDIGNTVVVVEHDEEIIRAADMLIDMGPLAGVNGGEVVFQGKVVDDMPSDVVDKSLTLQYITGKRQRVQREKRTWNYYVGVDGAMEHNLKDVNVKFPLGVLTVVSGVSGQRKVFAGRGYIVSGAVSPYQSDRYASRNIQGPVRQHRQGVRRGICGPESDREEFPFQCRYISESL